RRAKVVMKILFMTQFNDNEKIDYKFTSEGIIAEHNGIVDTFDFSEFTSDGELDIFNVETALSFNPIISAERKEGTLYVRLINFVPHDLAGEEEEILDWIEVGETDG